MRRSKKRKITHVNSDEKLQEECNVQNEQKEDLRKEEVWFPELCQATVRPGSEVSNWFNITQNINYDNVDVRSFAQYLPAFRSFVSLRIPNSAVRVKLNLPNFVIAPRLLQPSEDAMSDLCVLLKDIGFEVSDRATLAFFTIGSELDVRKAAERFLNFHKLANTAEFKSPNREIMESVEAEGCIEGFAYVQDGTFGPLIKAEKCFVGNHSVMYIAREYMCYILSMVNLQLLRRGLTVVFNARNLTYKNIKPFDQAKLRNMLKECLTLKLRSRFIIDPGMFVKLARKMIEPWLPPQTRNATHFLSLDEVRRSYPYVVLPKSITGVEDNELIKNLSVDKQFNFNFVE